MDVLPFICSFGLLFAAVDCYNILIIVGMESPSHFNVFVPIIEELSSRKHDVTVQAFHSLKNPLPNVKELKIRGSDEDWGDEGMKEFFRTSMLVGPIGQMRSFIPFMKQICGDYLTDATTKDLIDAGMQYDVVLFDALFGECQAAVGSLVGKHIIEVYTSGGPVYKSTAVPAAPSYVPNPLALMPSKMDFFQRFENTVNTVGLRYLYEYGIKAVHQEAISEFLPQAAPIDETDRKTTFTLTNGDPVVNSPRPTMPNFVHCGGMHCRAAKALPKDLNDFVESSGDEGFIIFGLGSNMKSKYLNPEELDAIVSAFSRLQQKVVWKFEAKLENLPKNVKIVDWMPQQDLLGHPKARLFITHSGLLSLQETIFHGVPVIGIPFFADQRGNIMRIKELGIGEYVNFLNLTADGFYEMINRILNDKSYYENMKKYSAIFKDQPERPVDRAAFWIEYVVRHDGARHFRSAGEDLNFFQYYLLDVVGFLLLVAATGLGVIGFVIKLIFRKVCGKKSSKKELQKKVN